jgi:hypothetical protein
MFRDRVTAESQLGPFVSDLSEIWIFMTSPTRHAGQMPFFASPVMTRLPQAWHLMYCSDLVARFMNCVLRQCRKLGSRVVINAHREGQSSNEKESLKALFWLMVSLWGTVKDWLFWSL